MDNTFEVRHLTRRYGKNRVLTDVTLTAVKGTCVGIAGRNGIGKSTLFRILAGVDRPDSGRLTLFGRDLLKDRSAFGELIGYVPQNAIIFSGSVTMNVNYGDGSDGRTIEDVRRALAVAQAEDFVAALPEQEESHISQKGKNLSGGQKQRIAIARAVCRDPEIYILDDSFSALDYKTDKTLREALRRETEGSTVIIVAQRIGTIRDADEILVLDEGRIVGRGKHRQLLESCPLYREIARSQLTEEELL